MLTDGEEDDLLDLSDTESLTAQYGEKELNVSSLYYPYPNKLVRLPPALLWLCPLT